MSDPITIATASGIASGLATFWSMEASAWIKSYFVDHHPTAIEKAQQNSSEFLIELSNRVSQLENKGVDLKNILEDPEFSSILQNAVLASAQTDSKEKHILLADIVKQRLEAEPDSLISLATKIAVDTVSKLNHKQLLILELIAEITCLRHIFNQRISFEVYSKYFENRFERYQNLPFSHGDIFYLMNIGCLSERLKTEGSINFVNVIKDEVMFSVGIFELDDAFFSDGLANRIKIFWDENLLHHLKLTTVGKLVALTTINHWTNENIDIKEYFF